MAQKSDKKSSSLNDRLSLEDGRTKFDRWLVGQKHDHSKIIVHFAVPPRSDAPDLSNVVSVIEVDRYMLLLEFSDGETWWVSKSIITSAGADDSDEFDF
jgi:hypothetical protein